MNLQSIFYVVVLMAVISKIAREANLAVKLDPLVRSTSELIGSLTSSQIIAVLATFAILCLILWRTLRTWWLQMLVWTLALSSAAVFAFASQAVLDQQTWLLTSVCLLLILTAALTKRWYRDRVQEHELQ